MRNVLLLALALAQPAAAQSALSAEEFDAYTKGKTFTYANGAAPYGAEEYLEGRRVRWSLLDGRCMEGEWYTDTSGLICFVYENKPDDPQCWSFHRAPTGLVARYQNDPQSTELYEIGQSPTPLHCLGPEVGV